MRKFLLAACAACVLSSSALADFDLQVTEIWPGNEPNDSNGDNQTGDWFEVTNVGDMAWISGTDGPLFFDDKNPILDEIDPILGVTAAGELSGIAMIAPGESVIFVDDDLGVPTVVTGIWESLWSGPLTAAGKSLPQLGTYVGNGLWGNGDTVNLFLVTGSIVELDDIIDSEAYDDANSSGGQTWDVVNGIYSNASFAVVTAANDTGNPSTGTPGFVTVVPEPTSLALVVLGMIGVLLGARRK